MALIFIGIDPRRTPSTAPAVFAEEETGDLLFDDRLVRFHHFSGDGEIVEDEMVSGPAVIRLCQAAFEAVWDRAIPHDGYRLA